MKLEDLILHLGALSIDHGDAEVQLMVEIDGKQLAGPLTDMVSSFKAQVGKPKYLVLISE